MGASQGRGCISPKLAHDLESVEIASKPIALRATTLWPRASPWRACGYFREPAQDDLEARAHMMMSAVAMGAASLQKGLGAIRVLSSSRMASPAA
jgi:hypothetical protein